MSKESSQHETPITAEAFRALGVWAFQFSSHLRDCAIELAREDASRQGTSPGPITIETLHRALGSAWTRTTQTLTAPPQNETANDELRPKVA